MWQPLLLSAGCVPALILLAAVFFDRWRRKRRGERQPLSEKLLRPAGYSLQRRLEDVNDSFNFWFMGACFLSLPALGVFAVTPKDAIARISFLVLFGLAAAGCAVMAWRRLKQIRDYRRGLAGEQAVAEQFAAFVRCRLSHFSRHPRQWQMEH